MPRAANMPVSFTHAQDFIPHAFRDRLRQNADLSKTNWFRVGGPAEWLFKPENTQDLSDFFKQLPSDIPVTVLGVGSNVIVRDGGIEGVVVKLGRGFTQMEVDGGSWIVNGAEKTPTTNHYPPSTISVGAACLDVHVAQFACDNALAGLEFLVGIPGTIGGAVRMNAGAYGADMEKVLIAAEVVERDGAIRKLTKDELGFTYRNSRVSAGTVVTRAWLLAHPGNKDEIARKMAEISSAREETQPVRARTGGSTFKNPIGHKAWELIEQAGCRGLTLGGAQVSEKHCNFLINTGNATAADIENLGEEVIRRVKEKTGITLEWEIKRIGRAKT